MFGDETNTWKKVHCAFLLILFLLFSPEFIPNVIDAVTNDGDSDELDEDYDYDGEYTLEEAYFNQLEEERREKKRKKKKKKKKNRRG